MKYLENLSNNPWYNLAFEEYCFKNLPQDEDYVILWINSPAIIVGKNQNTIEEINQEYVREHDIKIVRRITGGGAVYHDLGNLNFSIITTVSGEVRIDFGKINIPMLKSLENLGINAELSGRNDLTLEGKKFSGIAQSVWKNRVLNHGTILFDTDLTVLSSALNVKKDKIESKGVKSVKSRVTNIRPYLTQDLNLLTFKDLLLKNMFALEGLDPTEYILSDKQKEEINRLYKEKYNTWDWNYGESPQFDYKNYKRYPFGSIDVRLGIKNGVIQDAKVYGDFFGTEDVSLLQDKLKGSRYDRVAMEELLQDETLNKYFGDISNVEFLDLLFE
ncbi:lipoate--protein ligase [Tissierella creatinini]|nr:lipoate--protein ligase [Tissierella creatinini]TJX62789.1 lipoate--protein ligase [Soehngenia saccharolytica]